jgi:hypothetical protein
MTNVFIGCAIGFVAAKLADLMLGRIERTRIIVHPQHYNELFPLLQSETREDSIRLWGRLNQLYPQTARGSWRVSGNDDLIVVVKL